MASMSKIMIIGNVGKDAEMRMTPNGKAVCDFSVAVNRRGGQGGQEVTDWYRVSCWGRQAEIAQQYVRKGTSIFVEGQFEPRAYTDKSGANRVSNDIQFASFTLLGSRQAGEGGMGSVAEQPGGAPPTFDPDEIPF